ncbi:MAG: hypothetical protein WBC44_09990 [Planctomycetaceae bacterium]
MSDDVGPLDSFAVCRIAGAPNSARRLKLDVVAQTRLGEMAREHIPHFIADDLNRVPFDPTFQSDEEHVICIEDFELPEYVRDAIATPDEVPVFSTHESVAGVKSLFHVGREGRVVFQCWRNFDLLGRRKILSLLSQDTFELESRTPFVIERRIDAVYWDGRLFFRSYANVSSMLEMVNYVAEATNDDIEAFVASDIFDGDASGMCARCSGLNRRRIRAIISSGLLAGQTVDGLCQNAIEVDYAITLRDGKIAIPASGQALSDLLCFLGEKIYRGPITGQPLLSLSSRRRQGD